MSDSCAVRQVVERGDRLFVPHRKRLKHSYGVNGEGLRELRIDYGLKEVTFDDERYFAFGEQLVGLSSFVAESAVAWGAGYSWEELQPMLEALLTEGILKRGDGADEPREGGLVPSPLPPSVCPAARFWNTSECEGITRDVGKRSAELGYLETFVPVYRVAHAAIDGDDRQVGEANVYPPALRLERSTEWRVCQYAGSRYRDDNPMNVTALKAMIKHWKPMMVALLRVREELARRLHLAGGPWTIGDLHTFACSVLALPAYVLQKQGGTTPQAPLHPVLSSLFRITDGIRMTVYEMFFLLSEKPKSPDTPMTASAMYDYAEQHGIFISDTGVCAGPKPLIDEFLTTAVDGLPISGAEEVTLAPEVEQALSELPAAIDYGLLGLQVWGLTSSTWLALARAYEALLATLRPLTGTLGPAGEQLLEALERDWHKLERVQISTPYEREVHFSAYKDAYERARKALPPTLAAASPLTLDQALVPVEESERHRVAATALRNSLQSRLSLPELGGDQVLDKLVEAISLYLREEHAVVAATIPVQTKLNELLRRPAPSRALSARDFLLFYALNGSVFPYLFDALESALGIVVAADSTSLEISQRAAG